MSYKIFDGYADDGVDNTGSQGERVSLLAEAGRVDLPDSSYISDSYMSRDGFDLLLETHEGVVTVDGYFRADLMPDLVAPNGQVLTPDLVRSFTRGGHEYAEAGRQFSDESPVGVVQELGGSATVTRLNGMTEIVHIGTPIYPGDVVETDQSGAVNIMFVDETTFAVSEDARLAIDEYVFDPATQSGVSNFSVLKGVFVFTSGLIGRDDPDDVMIDTPSGSIGIRGTIIAGDVDSGEITVIEGAIVLTDFSGNSVTLANQYETAKFNPLDNNIEHLGDLGASDVAHKFASVSHVAGDLFSSINDVANENRNGDNASGSDDVQQTQDQQDSENVDGTNSEDESSGDQVMQEMMTSDDIVGQIAVDSDGKVSVTSDKPALSSDNDGVLESGGNAPRSLKITPQDDVPFTLSVSPVSITEGAAGGDVALVTGNFTPFTNLSLVGPANNFYEIIRVDDNTLRIRLQDGVDLDAERPYKLGVVGTNASGASSVQQVINLNVANIDEATQFVGDMPNNSGAENAFAGSAGSIFHYNFGNDFYDPEGDISGFQFIDGASNPDIVGSSVNFNGQTGTLSFTLDSVIGGDSTYTFTIRALSDSGNVDQSFTFDVLQSTVNTTPLFTPGDVYAGADQDISIFTNNVTVFADSVDQNNTIDLISGLNATIYSGIGNDTVNVSAGSTDFVAFGGGGSDTFNLADVQNGHAYGGQGNDHFILNNTGTVSTMLGAGNDVILDGGHGIDVFHLSVGGGIDFTAINDAFIRNVEKIAFINGNSNNVTLSYTDVVAMTDDDNVLRIDVDSNDVLTFVNNNADSNQFYQVGQQSQSGGDYNIFTDGVVTLLVDTDAVNVTGIV